MPYIPLKVYFRPPEIAKLALFRPKIATVAPFCQKPPNWRFSLKKRQISLEIVKFGNFPPKSATVVLFRQKNSIRRFSSKHPQISPEIAKIGYEHRPGHSLGKKSDEGMGINFFSKSDSVLVIDNENKSH